MYRMQALRPLVRIPPISNTGESAFLDHTKFSQVPTLGCRSRTRLASREITSKQLVLDIVEWSASQLPLIILLQLEITQLNIHHIKSFFLNMCQNTI